MSERQTGDPVAIEELDRLDTDELRRRAFAVAEHRRDLGFFWNLMRHLPSTADAATEDGSSGAIGQTLADVVGMFRELTGRESYGDHEPLLRAAFIDYLRQHGDPGRQH